MSKKIPLLAATLTLIACSFALAQQEGEKEGRGKRRGPPPQAIEACASLSEGDTCSFEGRRGSVEGTCRKGPQGEGANSLVHPPVVAEKFKISLG